jgi:predicted nucleic acid-binding Zn finger protein
MTIIIDTNDSRSRKALEIAAEAGQWLKCRRRDGSKVYAVLSQSASNVYHLADLHTCTCPDFTRRQKPCKHILAIRIHCALVQVQAQRRREEVRATA